MVDKRDTLLSSLFADSQMFQFLLLATAFIIKCLLAPYGAAKIETFSGYVSAKQNVPKTMAF